MRVGGGEGKGGVREGGCAMEGGKGGRWSE